MPLVDLIELRKILIDDTVSDINLKGTVENLTDETIIFIKNIEEYVLEIQDNTGKIFSLSEISKHTSKTIHLKIALGGFPNYFESFSDLIEKYKYSFDLTEFYIHKENINNSNKLNNPLFQEYSKNLHFINFLSELADNAIISMGELKLYFHRINTSLSLPINYSIKDIENSKLGDITSFTKKLKESVQVDDKKIILINNLVDFYAHRKNKYNILLKKWSILEDNFVRSYNSYLEGFSFEKIKTSSLTYFQELTDKILETIRKVSNYLFAVPVAYIFLASRLDFENPSLIKNVILLILGYVFFILIWFIFFKNIKESLDSVKKEIERYEDKIKNIPDLGEIKIQLSHLKITLLDKQYQKLDLLKVFIVAIVIILTVAVYMIHN